MSTPDELFVDVPSWDGLFDDDEVIVVDEAVACSLENPESCEACD